ncbi:S24/S26 family peptidase [Nocardioides terrisoli]|uniref:S24/S26 family peptidase n=1 Tax=Nocardioides terrisoli TaxID=3388267 RepID=UPI00287B74F0|nr:S24/S26 family peptidase [Nocardioides marmorisolisilvae]
MRPAHGIAVVRGRSMLPTLRDGDRLLVRYGALPRVGRLAIVRLPDGVVSVKRLHLVDDEGYWFGRDNPSEGLDSWSFGRAATRDDVLAAVRCRLWPRPGRP